MGSPREEKKSGIMGTHAFDCAAGLLQVQQMEKNIFWDDRKGYCTK